MVCVCKNCHDFWRFFKLVAPSAGSTDPCEKHDSELWFWKEMLYSILGLTMVTDIVFFFIFLLIDLQKLRGCFLIWLRKIALVITTASEEGRPVGKVDFNQTTEKMSNARSFSAWDGKANRAATDFGLAIVFQSSIASISFKMSVGVHQGHTEMPSLVASPIFEGFFWSCSCSMNVGFHSKISQIPRSLKID